MRIPFVALCAALALTGCNQSGDTEKVGDASSAALAGTGWQLVSVGGKAVNAAPGDRLPPSLHFGDDGKVTGSGGCNQYGATYTRDGDRLSFGPIGATKMACPGNMDVEKSFFDALRATRSYRVKEGGLALMDADGELLARLENPAGKK